MSLNQSATLNRRDPHADLKDVLTRLPTQPASRLDELLPHPWQGSLRETENRTRLGIPPLLDAGFGAALWINAFANSEASAFINHGVRFRWQRKIPTYQHPLQRPIRQ
jgi:hypothetical protein